MSIFGKLATTIRQKVSVKQLTNGVTAQNKIGVNSSSGGNSGIFGGLFGKKKEDVAAAAQAYAVAQNQAVMQARNWIENKIDEKQEAANPFTIGKVLTWIAIGLGSFWLIKKLLK
jgi:hypothetical protein